jgi:hypothetical protein
VKTIRSIVPENLPTDYLREFSLEPADTRLFGMSNLTPECNEKDERPQYVSHHG